MEGATTWKGKDSYLGLILISLLSPRNKHHKTPKPLVSLQGSHLQHNSAVVLLLWQALQENTHTFT